MILIVQRMPKPIYLLPTQPTLNALVSFQMMKAVRLVNQGHGKAGTCIEYLQNTLDYLTELGIEDLINRKLNRFPYPHFEYAQDVHVSQPSWWIKEG